MKAPDFKLLAVYAGLVDIKLLCATTHDDESALFIDQLLKQLEERLGFDITQIYLESLT